MRIIKCVVAIVGAGAAGLNAMDELLKKGIDAVLLTDDVKGGTSINSGSDKQTYYKLSMAGGIPDSVEAMAEKFYTGGGMQGCHARAMAALSARSFMKLALLGVPFPQNEWGEYVGYQTDHDQTSRATSAGPLTSKMMAECLLASVKARGGRIIDGAHLISISARHNRARGMLFETDEGYLAVDCGRIILATGGPACVYGRRVYPVNQVGATGAALRAGAKANNLCYWQYGLASVKVRWNVSGSYQQAMPEYVDENGVPIAPDMPSRIENIFLKGYQWPFDSSRADKSGAVDRAVKAVTDFGGRVFMDFTREPIEDFRELPFEAADYLRNCSALVHGAYERLSRINPLAAEFYKDRGIDLSREPLEIALCAQHSNGGLWVDENWQTTIEGLYAAGECSGVFGIYRPGGSALNETQVGSLRAAEHIARNPVSPAGLESDEFEEDIRWHNSGKVNNQELAKFQKRMDICAGAVRSVPEMRALLSDVNTRLENLVGDVQLRDVLWVQKFALSAMLEQAKFSGSAGHIVIGADQTEGLASDYTFVTGKNGTTAVRVEPVPEGDQWFERVWNKRLGAAHEA